MPARLFLIDSFNFIFRAYFARARSSAPPMRTAAGIPTEAVYIFHNMVRRLINEYHPEYLAAVFESEGPTLREQEFAAYKANRDATPPDLLAQIPWVRQTLTAMGVPVIESDGYEADDVIGTLARMAQMDVVIVSSDKDMLQLVDERVRVLNPMKDDILYDAASVQAYMGVLPTQVRDLLALKGDAVDNIPGAPGIGDKGAKDLILRFGSLEAALERAAEVEKKTYRESLQNHREQILLSQRLATIEKHIPLAIEIEQLVSRPGNPDELREIYRQLEFFSLLAQLGPGESATPAAPEDFAVLLTAEEGREWLRALPPASAVGVVQEAGTAAVCGEAGVARSFPAEALDALGERPLIVHNWKASPVGEIARVHDVMLSGFLLLADPGDVDLAALSERYLLRKLGGSYEARAAALFELGPKLDALLGAVPTLASLYETLDRPILPILAAMERDGITVDRAMLAGLSSRMDEVLSGLGAEIHALAGRDFNINSPQQLGKVLFEELQLPAPFKTGKGKVISTAADVLEGLAPEHRIAQLVLDYRQVSKLKGTYVDALPALLDLESRVHTTFNPTGAATGRLSSNNPNLQNIPVRTELGREIRAAFVPRPGWVLVKVDYSQIELRLLAHFSGDAVLTDSFVRGEDIHTRTAAEVFGVPPLLVTPELRRNAKAVNFGIVYGQTAFGLASALGIPRGEADTYIKSYFARYAGVKRYIERTIAEVRKTGYAETLFGRRRPIPDMASKNPNARGFAERTAVNTPLQGTAADLIKRAMIVLDGELRAGKWESRLLLQVHDELVLESPAEEAPRLARLVKQSMEGVHRLNVPLVADASLGPNWRDAKT
ncbi:MAG: DNA polymerase I [Bryobacteraceae bacterium]|nr:DNA polymerase I [Bryobacteraceae bacterium]